MGPVILSASNNSPKEETNESNLVEIIQFLKDNRNMRCVVASFAVARNEFENAIDSASIPGSFSDVKWPVKIRFDITHNLNLTTSQGKCRYDNEKIRRHRTNGYYRLLDDADPIYKYLEEELPADQELVDLSSGVFVQDGPNGFSKGVQHVDIVRGNGPLAKHEIRDDTQNGTSVYILLRLGSDLAQQASPWDRRFAGGWVLHYCSEFNSEAQKSYPLCYSNAKGPLPPAFGRDWIRAPSPPIEGWAYEPRTRTVDRP